MAAYKVYFKRSAVKDLAAISKKDLQRIINRIDILKANPRPPCCERLSDQECCRVRQRNYRIVYSIQDDVLTVWVAKIGRRRDVYRQKNWRSQIVTSKIE